LEAEEAMHHAHTSLASCFPARWAMSGCMLMPPQCATR